MAERKEADVPGGTAPGGAERSSVRSRPVRRTAEQRAAMPPSDTAPFDRAALNAQVAASEGPEAAGQRAVDAEDVRGRWRDVQSSFVDGPREAVEEADRLSEEVLGEVVASLRRRRAALAAAWSGEAGPDTEAYRLALRDYRAFIDHLIDWEK